MGACRQCSSDFGDFVFFLDEFVENLARIRTRKVASAWACFEQSVPVARRSTPAVSWPRKGPDQMAPFLSLSAPQAFFDFFWLVPWQLAKCFCRRERATPGWRSFCSAQALRRPQQGPSSKTVSKYMLWCNLPFDVSCAVLYFLKLSTISIY